LEVNFYANKGYVNKVKPKLGKIREVSKKKTNVDSNILTLDEIFNKYMIVKKTEGLAPRTIAEYYNNYELLKEYLGNYYVFHVLKRKL
jgi:integrase/recombinase XerD